ncbi:resolvase [Streptomyces sp. NPDC056910]|uniref:resolvase n=1 Tax=Streptomyces sp. NPDC056910 TaxID=3345964 RepID=UPI003687DC51
MRAAYLEGRSIAALARDHDVSRGAIRTAVADFLPQYTAAAPDAPAPELPVALDMPGKVADFLRAADLEPAERATLDQGVTVRRGQGYTLRVTAVPAIHCRLLDGSPGPSAVPAHSARPAASTRTASAPSRATSSPTSTSRSITWTKPRPAA